MRKKKGANQISQGSTLNDHFDNQIHTKFVFCRKFITLFDAVDLEWFNLTESDDGHCNVDLEMFQ